MYYNNTRPKRNGKEKIKNANVAHLVERHLAKVEVASSSLVVRSRVYPVRRTSHCEVRLLLLPLGLTKTPGCQPGSNSKSLSVP